jgi:hypothetical protein
MISLAIFFISLKLNNNFYISSIITFISLIIIESKLTHTLLRKMFLSLIFILLALCLYLVKAKIYFIIFSKFQQQNKCVNKKNSHFLSESYFYSSVSSPESEN